MQKRFLSIYFPAFAIDWMMMRDVSLKHKPLVLVVFQHNRLVIHDTSPACALLGIKQGMYLADARAVVPSLQVVNYEIDTWQKRLEKLAHWCIRYTPIVQPVISDGLLFDITGCAHLFGGEKQYLELIKKRLQKAGFNLRIAIADSIGCAWGISRFCDADTIVETGGNSAAMRNLSPVALRLEEETVHLLHKMGLNQIGLLLNMPRTSLRRRFGNSLLVRIDQAMGNVEENLYPVQPVVEFSERLPCLEPISHAVGIRLALEKLINRLCKQLQIKSKGLRLAVFSGYRVDGKIEKISIATHRASSRQKHLYYLFEEKISTIDPGLGFELFILEAFDIEPVQMKQEKLWHNQQGNNEEEVAEFLDRITGKFGQNAIQCFFPSAHYLPELSFKKSNTIINNLQEQWYTGPTRPLQLLQEPHLVEVTAPIPDYPPMLFRYKGRVHKIIKADGPERIEAAWWIREGEHRDYYQVEDETGCRYWLFRLGHYDAVQPPKWFIHGFFP